MKKIIAVNGSPRQNGSTALVLQSALDGASSAGAETELIHLGDLPLYHGCKSCFSCKVKGGEHYGKCVLQDSLTPVLEKLLACDGILFGTPIYFGGETGLFRNLIERLFFAHFRYDEKHSSLIQKKFPVAFVYTMNVTEEQMEQIRYPERLKMLRAFGGHLFGNEVAEALYVCDTFQFSDYSLYDAELFDAEHKAQVRREQFPEDLRKAFDLGRRIACASGSETGESGS